MSAVWTELWPYLVLILVGFLPNEIWRVLGLVLARGLDEDSEVVVWSRAVATAILAGVIAKLILFSTGALDDDSVVGAGGAAAVCGFLAFLACEASVFAGVLAGEAALLLGGYFCSRPRHQPSAIAAAKLLGLLGQHVRLFLLARRRLHRRAALRGITWTMQVEHHLSAGAFVELLDGDAVGAENAFIARLGDLLRDGCDMREIVGAESRILRAGAFGSTRV